MNKVYEVYVPVHVGTYATVIAESEDQAIDILYDRFRDSKEVHEHLKTSTDWFTDPRHSEIAKEGDWFCYESELFEYDAKLDEVVLSEKGQKEFGMWEES